MSLYINQIATAVPEFSVTQPEAFEHFQRFFDLSDSEERWYARLFQDSPIAKRHLALADAAEITNNDQDELIQRFKSEARKLGTQAAADCLAAENVAAAALDRITVNTCTGYLCPGLTSYLAEDLGLRKDVNLCDIMGMGCGGALPNLQATADYVRAHPDSRALSVPVEICTATFFRGDDPGLMVSNAIFGDGAGALLVSETEGPFEIVDFASLLLTKQREKLMYKSEDGKLRNVLSPEIPEIGAGACEAVLNQLLAANNLDREDVAHWAVHPGGQQVLDEVRSQLELTDGELQHSYSIFENYGNMSSASVVFVLEEIAEESKLNSGDYVAMISFGAGFTAFACLLRVT